MSEENIKKVILGEASGEITEKKSRFIAYCKEIHSEEEAYAFISEIKKTHWDARHNCYAFCLGENCEITRSSDDKEPQGTAGRPILDVIMNNGMTNIIIVVTRYFGGVLLGTGGLTRAYSQAASEGLKNSRVSALYSGEEISFNTDYSAIGKIQNLVSSLSEHFVISIKKTDYNEAVTFTVTAEAKAAAALKARVTELTSGAVTEYKTTAVSFVKDNGGIKEYSL